METPPEPIELGTLGKLAAFLCFTAGTAAIFAGGQIAAVIIFRESWQEVLPWLQVGLGVAATYLSTQLAYPRRWAVPIAAAVLFALTCGGVPWAFWLMYNGVFTALTVFSPGWATLAALVLAISLPSFLKIGAARARADAETARLTQQAQSAGYGYARPPRGDRGWLLPLIYGVLLVPVTGLILAIGWPDTWAPIQLRALALLHGRPPWAGFVEDRKEYPYPYSPFQHYAAYEAKFRPLNEHDVVAFADSVAADVAFALTAETGERDLQEAEAALWAEGNQKQLPLWIAASLRRHQAFTYVESLLSRSFDPTIHRHPDAVHFDCDQLVYLFMHVGYRLDLAMHPLPAPLHLYLRYDGPAGSTPLYVETTHFPDVDDDGNAQPDSGDVHFFVDEGYYRRGDGGSYASEEVTAAARLYEPFSERDIDDEIAANVIEGLSEEREDVPYSEIEPRLTGTRSVTLVANLYKRYVRDAKRGMDAGDLETARTFAQKAHDLRQTQGALVIYGDAEEEGILAMVNAGGSGIPVEVEGSP